MASAVNPSQSPDQSAIEDAINRLSSFGRLDDREQHFPARHSLAPLGLLGTLTIIGVLTLLALMY
jgi:hypothetical protein